MIVQGNLDGSRPILTFLWLLFFPQLWIITQNYNVSTQDVFAIFLEIISIIKIILLQEKIVLQYGLILSLSITRSQRISLNYLAIKSSITVYSLTVFVIWTLGQFGFSIRVKPFLLRYSWEFNKILMQKILESPFWENNLHFSFHNSILFLLR